MKFYLAPCNSCKKRTNILFKEVLGIGLILLTIPYLILFGIYASTIVWALWALATGLYWIIKRPSKYLLCDSCLKKVRIKEGNK
jgi:hypothetical protein